MLAAVKEELQRDEGGEGVGVDLQSVIGKGAQGTVYKGESIVFLGGGPAASVCACASWSRVWMRTI